MMMPYCDDPRTVSNPRAICLDSSQHCRRSSVCLPAAALAGVPQRPGHRSRRQVADPWGCRGSLGQRDEETWGQVWCQQQQLSPLPPCQGCSQLGMQSHPCWPLRSHHPVRHLSGLQSLRAQGVGEAPCQATCKLRGPQMLASSADSKPLWKAPVQNSCLQASNLQCPAMTAYRHGCHQPPRLSGFRRVQKRTPSAILMPPVHSPLVGKPLSTRL